MDSDLLGLFSSNMIRIGESFTALFIVYGVLQSLIKSDVEKKIENNMTKLCRHGFYEIVAGFYVIFMSLSFPYYIWNNEKWTSIGVYASLVYIFIMYLLVGIFGDRGSYNGFKKLKIDNKKWLNNIVKFVEKHRYLLYGSCIFGCVLLYYFLNSLFLSIFNVSMHTTFVNGAEIVKSTIKDYGVIYAKATKEEASKAILAFNRFFLATIAVSYVMSRIFLTPVVTKIKNRMTVCYVDVYLNGNTVPNHENLKFVNMNNESYIFEVEGTDNKLLIPKQSVNYIEVKPLKKTIIQSR